MPKPIIRKGRKGFIQKRVKEKKREAVEASSSSEKRPRVDVPQLGDDEAMYEAGFDDTGGYAADDDDDLFQPMGATDFDEADLAESIIDAANVDNTTFIIDPEDGDMKVADDDGPTAEDALALADYQIAGEGLQDTSGDEADNEDEDLDVLSESITIESSVEPSVEQSVESTLRPGMERGKDIAVSDRTEAIYDTMIVATGDTAGPGPEPTDPFAGSKPFEQARKPHQPTDFATALGIYCIDNQVSRKQYTALLEMLKLLKTDGSAKIDALPNQVDVLKARTREFLPTIEMRSKEVVLNPKKLSTTRRISSTIKNIVPSQDLFYINPQDMFRRVVSSKLTDKMHFGMAQLVDSPTEAWHARQWAGSIRTTSGDFVFYPVSESGDDIQEPIFPGDFIEFRCGFPACGCHKTSKTTHNGQVFAVYRDHRQDRRLGEVGDTTTEVEIMPLNSVVLLVGRLSPGVDILKTIKKHKRDIKVNPLEAADLLKGEQILRMDPVEYIDANSVIRRLDDISLDYAFGSQVQFDDDPEPSSSSIRRVYHRKQGWFLPACQVPPVPGVLEVNQFTRKGLINLFVGQKARSVPVYNFNDGFALYRTLHKSIMGCYLFMMALPKTEHTRQINVLPVTLGPHGANFEDVTKALAPLRALERGIKMLINGEEMTVCVPILAFIGDMPQALENSGCLGVGANLSCRFCMVPVQERGDLQYDTIANRRGHYEMLRLRRALNNNSSKRAQQAFSTAYGISLQKPAARNLAPALDIIGGCPGDTAHSENGGMAKMAHSLLLDIGLKPKYVVEYARALQRMPFPPGWGQIQSPYHVLSYTLSEHSRWSLLIVVICLYWLKEEYLKPAFVKGMKIAFEAEIRDGRSVVDMLTIIFTGLVKSNTLLTASELTTIERDPDVFQSTIKDGRRLLQRLCEAAAISAGTARGAAQQKLAIRSGAMPPPSAPSRAGSVALPGRQTRAGSVISSRVGRDDVEQEVEEEVLPSTEEDVADDINVGRLSTAQKAIKYGQWAGRPNVHVGLHYVDDLEQYGLPSLQMVNPGEMKHKKPKAFITGTNHRNPERDFLQYETLQQSIRFVLADGFAHDEPYATDHIKDVATKVPTVFSSLLPPDSLDPDEEDVAVTTNKIVGTGDHIKPAALAKIKVAAAMKLGLPVREKQMSSGFDIMLYRAYKDDYGKSILVTGNKTIQWWKKVSFAKSDNPSVRRSVFKRGHYVVVRGGTIGRLDHIFAHEPSAGSGAYHVFLIVTPLENVSSEPLTGLPVLKPCSTGVSVYTAQDPVDTAQMIVGLPALDSEKLYMVPYSPGNRVMVTAADMDEDGTDLDDCEVLHVNWRLHSHG